MMKYKIQIKKSVEKDISSYDKNTNSRLIKAIQDLQFDPYRKAKKLSGKILYRIRVGKYRIVYEIIEKDSLLVIYKISHRRDVYRK